MVYNTFLHGGMRVSRPTAQTSTDLKFLIANFSFLLSKILNCTTSAPQNPPGNSGTAALGENVFTLTNGSSPSKPGTECHRQSSCALRLPFPGHKAAHPRPQHFRVKRSSSSKGTISSVASSHFSILRCISTTTGLGSRHQCGLSSPAGRPADHITHLCLPYG